MLHHESGAWTDARVPARGAAPSALAVLAYRSRATSVPSAGELEHLLRTARERNRAMGLTGLLIYERGHFFQWLEGPKPGLLRVWDSIRRDPRHHDLTILRQVPTQNRFFASWDMRLAKSLVGDLDAVIETMKTPRELLDRLQLLPGLLAATGWDQVITQIVVPRLKCSHPVPTYADRSVPRAGSGGPGMAPAIWHAQGDAGPKLAGTLLALDPADTSRYVDALIEQGAGLESLYHEVFEPAARCLGGWWEDDTCNDFSMTLALARLQLEVRRASHLLACQSWRARPNHSVLLAQQPGETHGLNMALSSELFFRGGWDVSCEIPRNDNMLRELLQENWYDVLDLSLSGALRRDQQLPAMRVTIRAARAASLNPALAVMVDGRSFVEQPLAYLDVGADVGCLTSTSAVSLASQLVDAVTATALRSVQPVAVSS